MSIIICPVCSEPLNIKEKPCLCAASHSFDRAKEGYLNLLLSHQHKSRHPGDSPQSCRARRAFLSGGYYEPLAKEISTLLHGRTILDACCGEGYYTSFMTDDNREVYGFDIAKDMIKLASKREKRVEFFVAGLNKIPVMDKSVDTLTHLFAPINDAEFARILKSDGIMIDVIPGKDHLMGLKRILYDVPYENPVLPFDSECFLQEHEKVLKYDITVDGEDVMNLFHMTPYAYKTALSGEEKLSSVSRMETTVEFVIRVYKKQV